MAFYYLYILCLFRRVKLQLSDHVGASVYHETLWIAICTYLIVRSMKITTATIKIPANININISSIGEVESVLPSLLEPTTMAHRKHKIRLRYTICVNNKKKVNFFVGRSSP